MDGMDGSDGTSLSSGPGLEVETMEVGIDATTRIPFAVLRFTDADGMPLDREGIRTEGEVDVSFTVAYLPIESRLDGDVVLPYVNYITRTVMSDDGSTSATQPATDSGGTWTAMDEADGIYRYDFGEVLPTDYDATRTHTIGYYASRTYAGVRYVANDAPNFRPDGMAVTETRDIVTNDACNNCHTPLALHGGRREDVRLCATCHAPGYEDPDSGNTLDFQTMVHKIHRGADLPSVQNGVPYEIVGYMGRVHDYSEVEFPQDVRNCTTCHAGADGENWNTVPSRASCGSCHDDIWFEMGDPPESWQMLHPGGDRPDDDRCTTCHIPTGVGVSPIIDRHYYPYTDPSSAYPEIALDAVTLSSSRQIEVEFTITLGGAPHDVIGTPIDRLRFRVAGPTTDYLFQEDYDAFTEGTLTAIDASMGQFRYVVPDTVDAIATAAGVPAAGSWAVSVESRDLDSAGERLASNNPVAAVAITDPTAVPRRAVVSTANCNTCHEPLGFHGGNRTEPDYCAFCHNPTLVEGVDAPAMGTVMAHTQGLAPMIHRIHSSSDIEYPADLLECSQCHLDGTWGLPLADSNAGYTIAEVDSSGTVTPMNIGSAAGACGGCHSSSSAAAHFETNTTASGGEACGSCHGNGATFSVETAHARPEYQFR
jgi:OmcA/MtrC family decaheme c-type cytochrome